MSLRDSRVALAIAASALLLAACRGHAVRSELDDASGVQLFQVFCSSCHGLTGHGDGPVAHVLQRPPPDLTQVAARNGGTFPSAEVFRIIDGQSPRDAHGTREMPVWGYEFFGDDADDRVAHQQASERIEKIVGHLRALQNTY